MRCPCNENGFGKKLIIALKDIISHHVNTAKVLARMMGCSSLPTCSLCSTKYTAL